MLIALAGVLAALLGNDLTMLRVATGVSALVVLAAVWTSRGREQGHERELALQAESRRQDTAVFVDEIGGLRASLDRASEQLTGYRGKLTEATAELERASAARDEAEQALRELEKRQAEQAAQAALEAPAARPAGVSLTVEMFERAHAALAELSGDGLLAEPGATSELVAAEDGATPWIGVLAVEPGQLWLPGQDGESATEAVDEAVDEATDEFDVPTLALVTPPALIERGADVPSLAIELGPAPTYARTRPRAVAPARPVVVPAARAVDVDADAAVEGDEQRVSEADGDGGAVVDLTAHDQTEALRLPTIKRGRRRA